MTMAKSGHQNSPEFASWASYQDFSRNVRRQRRYVWTAQVQAFLDTVRATIRDRDEWLPKDSILYRAQEGTEWELRFDEEGNELGEWQTGFGEERMKPLADRASEGRANPNGIPMLYLGTTERTAISEIRPWIGAQVSVAQLKTNRPLRILNLAKGHDQSSFNEVGLQHILGYKIADAATKERAVWIDIDNAFTRPVTRSDQSADYVPTQILTELFRDCGYNGIVFKSQFDDKGYNVALFDPVDADVINCAPYAVTKVSLEFKETGERWFRKSSTDS